MEEILILVLVLLIFVVVFVVIYLQIQKNQKSLIEKEKVVSMNTIKEQIKAEVEMEIARDKRNAFYENWQEIVNRMIANQFWSQKSMSS